MTAFAIYALQAAAATALVHASFQGACKPGHAALTWLWCLPYMQILDTHVLVGCPAPCTGMHGDHPACACRILLLLQFAQYTAMLPGNVFTAGANAAMNMHENDNEMNESNTHHSMH